MNMVNEWRGKRVKVVLTNGEYYKGLVLSDGDDYIKLRDIHDKQVLIRLDQIIVLKEVDK